LPDKGWFEKETKIPWKINHWCWNGWLNAHGTYDEVMAAWRIVPTPAKKSENREISQQGKKPFSVNSLVQVSNDLIRYANP